MTFEARQYQLLQSMIVFSVAGKPDLDLVRLCVKSAESSESDAAQSCADQPRTGSASQLQPASATAGQWSGTWSNATESSCFALATLPCLGRGTGLAAGACAVWRSQAEEYGRARVALNACAD